MKKITYQCENKPSMHFQRIEEETPKTVTCLLCDVVGQKCTPIFVESEEYDPADDFQFQFPIEEDRIVKFNTTQHGETKTIYEIRECYYSKNYEECFGASPAPYKNCQAETLKEIKKIAKENGYDHAIARNIEILASIN